ncbi:MAG: hypothetical protein R3E68_10280 [Burkholderiaceae bacterium]
MYRYALSQPVNPVYGSDYIRKVHDYEAITFSKEIPAPGGPDGQTVWRIRSGPHLRTVRLPDAAVSRIDWRASVGVAGFSPGRDGHYVHLAQADARLVYAREPGDLPPIVESGNGRISALRRDGNDLKFRFSAYVPPEFRLVHPTQCRVSVDGRVLKARTDVAFSSPTARSGQQLFRYSPKLKDARSGILVSVDC